MLSKSVGQLKRDAKRMKKAQGCTHVEALNAIAKQEGYSTWAILMKSQSGR